MGAGLTRSAFHKCEGPVIGTGFSCPTDKNNHALVILRGIRQVRRCEECGENFSYSKDLLEPGVKPSEEVRREFEMQEGRPVIIEAA